MSCDFCHVQFYSTYVFCYCSNNQTKEIKYFYENHDYADSFRVLHSQVNEVHTFLYCHDKYVKLPYHPILLSSASDKEEWQRSNPRDQSINENYLSFVAINAKGSLSEREHLIRSASFNETIVELKPII